MNRITQRDIEGAADTLNRLTGSPAKPYTDGKANVGNYHIDYAYGGASLHRMHNEHGGVENVFRCGHVTKRDLYGRIWAMVEGLRAAAGPAKA